MGARRAVLIGVPKNKRDNSLDLPVVYNDISLLHSSLEGCGYAVTSYGIDDPSDVSANSIEDAINDACLEAPVDSTLLLYFSGHGIHYNGKDLLVPWDGHFGDPRRIEKSLISTDISPFVERSRARLIVFFIDACREDFQWQIKSVSRQGWGREEVKQTERGQFVRVYSCRSGEFSQYASEPRGFSLFSKALATVLAPTYPAESLKEVLYATQEELDKLIGECGKSEQHIHTAGEQELNPEYLSHKISDKQVVESGRSAIDAHWQELAAESRVWSKVNTLGQPSWTSLIEHSGRIVAACEQEWLNADSVLPSDPWRDYTYPLRVITCLEMLVNSSPRLNLSPTEASILITSPFIREAVYSCSVSIMAKAAPLDLSTNGNRPTSSVRRKLEMTHAAYPQLVRKVNHANSVVNDGIAFWIMHRSIMRDPDMWQVRPEGYISEGLFSSLKLYQDEPNNFSLTERQLIEFAQCINCDPARIERGDRTYVLRERVLVGSGELEQQIREQLLGYLLCIAGWMALDVRAMSDVLPDHLGIADPVDPVSLLKALRVANWRAVGTGRSVDVRCLHPAIDYSIRELVIRSNEVLATVHRRIAEKGSYLECLSNLPSRLGTELIVPEILNGKPAYETPHLNFQLAHDEVRELLMGEQLYDHPELAVRELYQNALDACRYRRARLQYLERTGQLELADNWQGRIEFKQGIHRQKGRYIECRDNGIGMSHRELENCFAKAGKRFCDLPEFIEEQNEWLRCNPPIRIYPNSQFGVGVFSYFMLADELEVETCRIDRKGHPGQRLLITIPGSGSLFRVQELGVGEKAGTRVRLYLRDSEKLKKISCVDILASLLWVSEFHTEAKHGQKHVVWEPEVLRHPLNPLSKVPKDPDLPLWWTTNNGQILADGIRTFVDDTSKEKKISKLLSTGIVVNLCGEHKPGLTVDRRKVRFWDESWVRESARVSMRCLYDWEGLSYMWLWSLFSVFPECEEVLNRQLKQRNRIIPVKGEVGGKIQLIDYSKYHRGEDNLFNRIFNTKKAPTLNLNFDEYDAPPIDPTHIGVSKIQVSNVGVIREDVLLWRLVWEAWSWEFEEQGKASVLSPYYKPQFSHPLFEDEHLKNANKKYQLLELQLRISKWDKELNNRGIARLATWQHEGLLLPDWLVEALERLKLEGLHNHYYLGLIPKSGEAWTRIRNKALLQLLRFKRVPVKMLFNLMLWVLLLLLIYFLAMGCIALTKYVFN